MEQLDRDRLGRLIEVGRGMMAELDPEALLRRILEVARELTGARYAALGVLDERREELERFVTLGIDDATHAAIGDLPRGRGVLGELIVHPAPLRLEDVSYHPRSYGFPLGHPEMHTFLGVPILIRGEAWGNLYLTEKAAGEEFSAADEEALVVLADWAAIAMQNARLYRGVRERRDELERAVRTLEATNEITRAVGGEVELARILELIAKRGRALVEARMMMIALLQDDEMRIVATAGQVPRDLLGSVAPVDESVGGFAIRTARIERLDPGSSGLHVPWAERLGARAGLIVPLRFRGSALGVMAAYDRYGDDPRFRADDERLMEAVAASAATAVATAQHVAAEGTRGRLEASQRERDRWARELHDETLQELSALKLTLGGVRRSDDLAEVQDALDEADASLGDAIDRLRALILELRPGVLGQLPTGPALEALVQRVRNQSDLQITLEVDLGHDQDGRSPARLAPELEATIYRTVQEALNNVLKHADASSAVARVRRRDGSVEVSVADDGRGFDAERPTRGLGLLGMRERAMLAGGTLTVRTAPGTGTEIRARLPVQWADEFGEPGARRVDARSAG
jgi:signal transduction histidine kinase